MFLSHTSISPPPLQSTDIFKKTARLTSPAQSV